jgi:succinyl-CoA synthetase beta subunit/citryl-CoA synthetase large subunit
MRLTEYQSKELLAEMGLPVTRSQVAQTPEQAKVLARQVGGPVVIKAQVPFGGRGKAGAVRFGDTPEAAEAHAREMIGMPLRHLVVQAVSVENKVSFTGELYVGVTWDTRAKRPVALLSTAGGVDVESASNTVARRHVDAWTGLPAWAGREMACEVGLTGKTMVRVGAVLADLASAFVQLDATTLEINPLVESTEGQVIGLDAHIEMDDDAADRQKRRLTPLGSIAGSGSAKADTALEAEAKRIDAMDHRGVAGRVVEFDGDMALLIGGGGASLTVFDAIRRHGGRPANYCEVGGNPTEEKVAALTRLLLSKRGVKSLAVIMNVVNNTRADVMARGVLMGVEQSGRIARDTISVFRIPGSWEQEAHAMLAEAQVVALSRDVSLDEAARLAVERSASGVA